MVIRKRSVYFEDYFLFNGTYSKMQKELHKSYQCIATIIWRTKKDPDKRGLKIFQVE